MADILTLRSFVLLLLISSSVPLLVSSTRCHKDDKKALLSFIDAFGPAARFPTWTANTSCCEWRGITCDAGVGHRVTGLSILDEAALRGPIPPAVGDLPFLTDLNLYQLPNLVGPIPPQIANLRNLAFLTISRTNVSGAVPAFIGDLPSLGRLDLSLNSLSGPIPAALGRQPSLNTIYINDNRLTGAIPASLLQKAKDAYLILSNNELTGPIPLAFGGVDFANINLSGNRLTGDASFLFGRSKGLQQVVLSSNRLEFDLTAVEFPEEVLSVVSLEENMITGSVPPQIATLKMLQYFNVSYNRMCGEIPSGGNMGLFDQSCYLHNKCLCGPPLKPCK